MCKQTPQFDPVQIEKTVLNRLQIAGRMEVKVG